MYIVKEISYNKKGTLNSAMLSVAINFYVPPKSLLS